PRSRPAVGGSALPGPDDDWIFGASLAALRARAAHSPDGHRRKPFLRRRTSVSALAVVWIALVAGSEAHAGKEPLLPPGIGRLEAPLRDVHVGDWVSYRIGGGAGREGHWRIAVVGEGLDARGRPALWLEMEFGNEAKLAAPLL